MGKGEKSLMALFGLNDDGPGVKSRVMSRFRDRGEGLGGKVKVQIQERNKPSCKCISGRLNFFWRRPMGSHFGIMVKNWGKS